MCKRVLATNTQPFHTIQHLVFNAVLADRLKQHELSRLLKFQPKQAFLGHATWMTEESY